MNWYQLHIKEIMQKLGTSEEGLTDNEVSERLQHYGLNKLVEEEKISRLKILFHQFISPLIHTIELKIEEAMLTGESIPAEKSTSPMQEDNLTPGDQKNMTFMGTIVVSGRAKGIVVETGVRTILGQIAEKVKEVSSIKTPLQDKLERFAKLIGIVIVGFSIVLFGVGLIHGAKVSEMFMVSVATAVSAIPEGLPVAVTIAMAIGVARMARRNAIIRKLPAVETCGSTTIYVPTRQER